MDKGLLQLILNYQLAVQEAVGLIVKSGISQPKTAAEWVEIDIPQLGKLEGGIAYFKHGFGCAVDLPNGKVDFDFGSQGQIDGFDLWRLIGFENQNLQKYGFSTEQELEGAFENAIKEGFISQSEYILYYLTSKNA